MMVLRAGSVTGVDMTEEQLLVARTHVNEFTQTLGLSSPNLSFVQGYIEDLKSAGIQDDSVDMIISNCVVNLSPDKPSVLREAYRVLAKGGELYFSDVYCDRRLPKHVQEHEVRPVLTLLRSATFKVHIVRQPAFRLQVAPDMDVDGDSCRCMKGG
jgi:arsenite methyltransferase